MIFDHYLVVSLWSPKFNAKAATTDKAMVWIRIPILNLVYYDENILWTLASMVGKLFKVDLHTLRVARGKLARMCAEVDLLITCTKCGCYGHIIKGYGIKCKGYYSGEQIKFQWS